MPRCIFCDEWVGPSEDVHDQCLIDFKRQMRQPGLMKRLFGRVGRIFRVVFAARSGSAPRVN